MNVRSAADHVNKRIGDNSFFLFMALLLLLVAVVGFGPNSLAILSGDMASPPLIVHIHAATMLGWLLLLVAQAGLKFVGRMDLHFRLGVIAFVFVPIIVCVMIIGSYERLAGAAALGPVPPIRFNILLLQGRAILLFPLFIAWALVVRRSSPEAHKRFMIIATVVVLDAALARMRWLPGPEARDPSFESMSILQLALLMPLVAKDFLESRRLHRATLIGISIFALSAILVNLLWGAEWWHAVAADWAAWTVRA